MAKDWVDDENVSAEETLQRFEVLDPHPTETTRLPGGAVITPPAPTYGGTTVTHAERILASEYLSNGRVPATA